MEKTVDCCGCSVSVLTNNDVVDVPYQLEASSPSLSLSLPLSLSLSLSLPLHTRPGFVMFLPACSRNRLHQPAPHLHSGSPRSSWRPLKEEKRVRKDKMIQTLSRRISFLTSWLRADSVAPGSHIMSFSCSFQTESTLISRMGILLLESNSIPIHNS